MRSSTARALRALLPRFTGISSRRATRSQRAYWTCGLILPRSRGPRAASRRISKEDVRRIVFIGIPPPPFAK